MEEIHNCPTCKFWEYEKTIKTKTGKLRKLGVCQQYDEYKSEFNVCCRYEQKEALQNSNLSQG